VTVRNIELPTKFHERCVGALVRQISEATMSVISTNVDILYDRLYYRNNLLIYKYCQKLININFFIFIIRSL
jgi:hypothetical protein